MDNSNSAVFFGSKSGYYEKNANIQIETAEETIKFAEYKISEIKNGLFLDLGSGTGLVQKKMNEIFTQTDIISFDISFLPLLKNKKSVCGDFDFLPFSDNSFDGIISCSALQWSKNPKNVLQNSFNALKTNGKFILAVFGNGTLEELRFLQDKFGIKSLVSFYEQEYFEETMQEIGFSISKKYEKTFSQEFDSAYDALKSISRIGAASHGGKILTPNMLKEFVSQYEKLFENRKIIHEYKTFFYISEKK